MRDMRHVPAHSMANRVFVAGATGAIGRVLAPPLVAAGYAVAGTTRKADRAATLKAAGARSVILDVLDKQANFAALATERPAMVIYELTDLTAHDFAANKRLWTEGTCNLVDAGAGGGRPPARRAELRARVRPSGAPLNGLAREDEPLDVGTPDGRGQTVAGVVALERAVTDAPEHVALRYGPLRTGDVVRT
jgi:NAD(P)-dependent dehydrogenase (short-subunit alcohol dehydrogenase family)